MGFGTVCLSIQECINVAHHKSILARGALIGLSVLLTTPSLAEINSDQWRSTDRSMAELVDEGYELVSVVAPSNRARIYFLRKPGKVAQCREEAAPPPSSSLASAPTGPKGQPSAMAAPEDFPKVRINIECAELVRPESR
jgi:hypothetical protein